jgi:hypothetical protein
MGDSYVTGPTLSKASASAGIAVIPLLDKSNLSAIESTQLPWRPRGAPAHETDTIIASAGTTKAARPPDISAWTHRRCRRTRCNKHRDSKNHRRSWLQSRRLCHIHNHNPRGIHKAGNRNRCTYVWTTLRPEHPAGPERSQQ